MKVRVLRTTDILGTTRQGLNFDSILIPPGQNRILESHCSTEWLDVVVPFLTNSLDSSTNIFFQFISAPPMIGDVNVDDIRIERALAVPPNEAFQLINGNFDDLTNGPTGKAWQLTPGCRLIRGEPAEAASGSNYV